MARGVVIKVITSKGFCFVRGEDDGISRFTHASWVLNKMFDTLREGTVVEFTPENGDRGPRAIDVRPIINGNGK